MKYTNKTVLITGAARGIGAACAEKFASLGYRVILNYRTSEKEAFFLSQKLTETGAKVLCVRADVSLSLIHILHRAAHAYRLFFQRSKAPGKRRNTSVLQCPFKRSAGQGFRHFSVNYHERRKIHERKVLFDHSDSVHLT